MSEFRDNDYACNPQCPMRLDFENAGLINPTPEKFCNIAAFAQVVAEQAIGNCPLGELEFKEEQ